MEVDKPKESTSLVDKNEGEVTDDSTDEAEKVKEKFENISPKQTSDVTTEEEPNTSEEKISQEDEEKIDPPSEEFLEAFNSLIPTSETEEEEIALICALAWSQYVEARRQVVLEGNQKAWIACAIYAAMIKRKQNSDSFYAFSWLNIQQISGASIVELFDKIERYSEIIGSSKRIREHCHKIQCSLAIASVVYKKTMPIFRGLFLNSTKAINSPFNSYELLKIIWTVFCLLKKHLQTEDLLNSYNLVLCVFELFCDEICKLQLDELVNPELIERLADSECGTLEFLCKNFGGAVLDAKHFKIHWFNEKIHSVLNFNAERFFKEPAVFLEEWKKDYDECLLRKAEIDETMYLPTEKDFTQVFCDVYDGTAVELLKRGPDQSTFADVDLLLRMSTQSCLEKLTENKKNQQNASRTYILSSDNLFPTTPMDAGSQKVSKFLALIPEGWVLPGSALEIMCEEMKDNPLSTIACNAENLAQRFADQVAIEADELGGDFDPSILEEINMHQEFVRDLFYVIIERIIQNEREKKSEKENDLCNVYRKEEFLTSVFCCVIELLLFSYSSQRLFPWSLKTLHLEPICFQKIIQSVIRSLPEMSRDMVKHLNKKEEEVLEELGWTSNSPIWMAIERNPECIPSCDLAWKQPRMLAEKYSPVKRIRLDESVEAEPRYTAGSMTLIQFIGKVYYLASNRLNDICDRIKTNETGKRLCWTLFDHLLRVETHLMMNRHLDQNLLCVVYVVARYLGNNCTFMDLIGHYRFQAQAQSVVYREVKVDSALFESSSSEDGSSRDSTSHPAKLRCGSTLPINSEHGTPDPQCYEKVDLIMYYNKVFLPRLEDVVKTMEANPEGLINMPKAINFGVSPMKKALGERYQVFVTPLNTPTNMRERHMKYSINQSPRKDLQAINQMVNVGNSSYEIAEPKSYTATVRR